MEELLKEINDRLAALGEQVSEERLKEIVRQQFDALIADKQFAQKMRFAKPSDALVGTKFARYGLTLADVEWLHQVLTAARVIGKSRGPSQELDNVMRTLLPAAYQAAEDSFDGIMTRAMDTGESGYGAQLVGAQYVGELWDAARGESRIFGLLDAFEMTAPTAYLPVEVDIPEPSFVGESTASNASAYATVKTGSNRVSCTAQKFVIHQMWSGELEEDSIIPFVPFLRRQAALALAHYSDSVVLNGDTTNAATGNINSDDADPDDTKYYLAFDGIRHAALVDNTNNAVNHNGAAITYEAIKGLQAKMLDKTRLQDWGHPTNPSDLVFVCDPETADAISLLDEVITVDKFGPQATVLTGQVARIGPYPLIASIAMPKTEADGKVSATAANNIYGQLVAFNRRGLKVGWRRRVKIETERIPATDQTRIVYSLRMGLARYTPTGAASGIEWAAVLYAIGL